MTNYYRYPTDQFFDNSGNPLSYGKIYTYITGTSTPAPTYTDSTGGTPLDNPIILSQSGREEIWLSNAVVYRFKMYDVSTGAEVQVGETIDSILGVPSSQAPNNLSYITVSTESELSAERALTAGTGIAFTDAGTNSTLTIKQSSVVNAQTIGYTALAADNEKQILYTGAGGVTLAFTAAATLGNGWSCYVVNQSSGNITLDPNASETVNGSTTYVLKAGMGVKVFCNGSLFTLLGGALQPANNLSDITSASTARTNLGVVIGTNVQAYDATLDAFAAYNSSGILCQTAADTFTGRTMVAGSSKVTVTNGGGVAGAPSIDIVPGNISISGLSGYGTMAIVNSPAPIANGGTGQSTAAAAMNALSPITTTGDMIYSSSGTTNSRLAIGSSTKVLTSSGTIPQWSTNSQVGCWTYLGTLGTALSNNSLMFSSTIIKYKLLFCWTSAIDGSSISIAGDAKPIKLQFNDTTGGAFSTSDYSSVYYGYDTGGTLVTGGCTITSGSAGADGIVLAPSVGGTESQSIHHMDLTIMKGHGAANSPGISVTGQVYYYNPVADEYVFLNIAGHYEGGTAVGGARIVENVSTAMSVSGPDQCQVWGLVFT